MPIDWSLLLDPDSEVGAVVLNLLIVLVLGQLLSMHYVAFARVLSNKRKFAPILVFVAATTMLVISVVKSSVALSLGLVGALSIIRFRTPIKEPEDLAYLFLAVAIGVGTGAEQRILTPVFMVVIMLFSAALRWKGRNQDQPRTLLHVNAALGDHDRESALAAVKQGIGNLASESSLARMDTRGSQFDATFALTLQDGQSVGSILDAVSKAFPDAELSIVEASSTD